MHNNRIAYVENVTCRVLLRTLSLRFLNYFFVMNAKSRRTHRDLLRKIKIFSASTSLPLRQTAETFRKNIVSGILTLLRMTFLEALVDNGTLSPGRPRTASRYVFWSAICYFSYRVCYRK